MIARMNNRDRLAWRLDGDNILYSIYIYIYKFVPLAALDSYSHGLINNNRQKKIFFFILLI